MTEASNFWLRPSFSVSEAADIIGVTEEALRGWLARNVTTEFNGTRLGHRLWLRGVDIYHFALVSAFASYGVSVRVAMLTAARLAKEAEEGRPSYDFLRVTNDGDQTRFEATDFVGATDGTPALILRPVDLFDKVLESATAVHATEVR